MKILQDWKQILLIVHILFIFLLVPTARFLERQVRLGLGEQGMKGVLLACVTVAVLTLIGVARRRQLSLVSISFRLSIVLFGGAVLSQGLDLLPVELFHVFLYGTLYWTCRLIDRPLFGMPVIASSFLITQVVSLIDELLQALHPERYFDLRDLLLNLVSALFGVLLYPVLSRRP